MKLVGLMPCRNEDWIIGLSGRVALMWCDHLVILDHASTDRTRALAQDIFRENKGRVSFITESDPSWDEMRHRQRMLLWAREKRGATHIAIIDADEILTGNLLPLIREQVEATQPGAILQVPLYNLRGGIAKYHASGLWSDRIVSLAFPDVPHARWQGDRFHAREPIIGYRPFAPVAQDEGGIMHLWGASERRLRAKHALYKVTERLRWPDKPVREIDQMYSWAIHERQGDGPKEWKFMAVPESWWAPYGPLRHRLTISSPGDLWQETEVRRLMAEHGAERFAGLDLFGVM